MLYFFFLLLFCFCCFGFVIGELRFSVLELEELLFISIRVFFFFYCLSIFSFLFLKMFCCKLIEFIILEDIFMKCFILFILLAILLVIVFMVVLNIVCLFGLFDMMFIVDFIVEWEVWMALCFCFLSCI